MTHQHGTTLKVNVLHNSLVQVDGLELAVIEASQSVSDAEDLVRRHAVVFQREDNVLDDVIETRAQTPTRDHSCCHLCTVYIIYFSASPSDSWWGPYHASDMQCHEQLAEWKWVCHMHSLPVQHCHCNHVFA